LSEATLAKITEIQQLNQQRVTRIATLQENLKLNSIVGNTLIVLWLLLLSRALCYAFEIQLFIDQMSNPFVQHQFRIIGNLN
jgi:hypothetical protein